MKPSLNDINYRINDLRFLLLMIKVRLMIKILSLTSKPKTRATLNETKKNIDTIYGS